MRERLPTVLLALLLWASPTLAVATAPTVVAPAVAEEADSETGSEDWLPGYQEVQGQSVDVSDGDLRATVVNSVLRPSGGYIPLEVVLFNPGATPRAVSISVDSLRMGRAQVSSRQVEVGPRQRLSAWMPVPSSAHGGLVRVQSPGSAFRPFTFYSVEPGASRCSCWARSRPSSRGRSCPA